MTGQTTVVQIDLGGLMFK